MTSRQVRNDLYQTLQVDFVGPDNGHEFERELLPETPTGWYLTGYLVPADADDDLRRDNQQKSIVACQDGYSWFRSATG